MCKPDPSVGLILTAGGDFEGAKVMGGGRGGGAITATIGPACDRSGCKLVYSACFSGRLRAMFSAEVLGRKWEYFKEYSKEYCTKKATLGGGGE